MFTLIFALTYSALLFASLHLEGKANRAVKGSLERYRYSTARKIAEYTLIGIQFILAVILAAVFKDYIWAGLLLATAMINLWIERNRHNDDDDWFKGRWKKIKNGAKKLLTSSSSKTALNPT
jgi:hypothetical protein